MSDLTDRLRESLALAEAEDRLDLRAEVAHRADVHRDAVRFGDLVAEIGRQMRHAAKRAQDPEWIAMVDRLMAMGREFAADNEQGARP